MDLKELLAVVCFNGQARFNEFLAGCKPSTGAILRVSFLHWICALGDKRALSDATYERLLAQVDFNKSLETLEVTKSKVNLL